MPVEVRKVLRESFPDSGWSVVIESSSSNEVDISLYWKGKDYPTHQVTVKKDDLQELLNR